MLRPVFCCAFFGRNAAGLRPMRMGEERAGAAPGRTQHSGRRNTDWSELAQLRDWLGEREGRHSTGGDFRWLQVQGLMDRGPGALTDAWKPLAYGPGRIHWRIDFSRSTIDFFSLIINGQGKGDGGVVIDGSGGAPFQFDDLRKGFAYPQIFFDRSK